MRFTPKTENEIAADGLFPAGTYDFEVIDAEEKLSSKGNDMIVLKLNVFDEHGNKRIVFDYLLEAMAHKLRHASEACGVLARYENGTLADRDFEGKTGKLSLKMTPAKGDYEPKNEVKDYLIPEEGASREPVARKASTPASDPFGSLDDSIPF